MKQESIVTRINRKKGVIFWNRPSSLSMVFSSLALVLVILSLVAAGVPIVPMVWYRIKPGTVGALEKILRKPAVDFEDVLVEAGKKEIYQPPVDESLSQKNRIMIPKIGVDTRIIEASNEDYEQALREGVWRTPDFGTAFERDLPMVLAAHRYGYIAWSNKYRRENSFFLLPELKEGDKVIVDWNQRRYVYVVYGGEESEEVQDYTADLILYTCKYLETPIRIFRYAKLLTE